MNIKSTSTAKQIAEEYAETVWNTKDLSIIDRLVQDVKAGDIWNFEAGIHTQYKH